MDQTFFIDDVEHRHFNIGKYGHLQNGQEFEVDGVRYRVKGVNCSATGNTLLCMRVGSTGATSAAGGAVNQSANQLANPVQQPQQPAPNHTTTTTTHYQTNHYHQNNRIRQMVTLPDGTTIEREFPVGYDPGPWPPGGRGAGYGGFAGDAGVGAPGGGLPAPAGHH